MKKIFCFFLTVLSVALTLCAPIGAAREEALSWYTTRNKEHRQALAAPELRFVEEYGGVYIDHRHGDTDADKVVYLTFDVGYENGNVEKTLNALADSDTPGAFFVLKHFVKENAALVMRMAEEGHLICNHTATHKNLAHATREEIATEIGDLERAVESVTGSGTKPYFRPPEGRFSREMLSHVASLGYKTVFWSFAYADWDNAHQPSPEAALKKILDNVHNGAVLLLHPTSSTNAEILPRLIAALKEEGYRFGTLDELCGAR